MTEEQTDIIIDITCRHPGLDGDLDRFRELAEGVCRRFSADKATVSIAIVGDDEITKVNAEFLDSTAKTDVISFDLTDEQDGRLCYELVINAEQAAREGEKRGHSAVAEIALYITHGLLHNLGFDDGDPDQAQKMHETEDEILQQAGFGIVYNNSN
jgi:probable rRNA maturation factor